MVTTLTPFPYRLSPLSNVAPFSYRDGETYLEFLERIRDWLNNTLVPLVNDDYADAIRQFQEGITNAENTITTTQGDWQTTHDAFTAQINAAVTAFETAVNTRQDQTDITITGAKTDWQNSFDAFMADVDNQLAALNDAAVAGLVPDPGTATGAALQNTFARRTGTDIRTAGAVPGTTDAGPAFLSALTAAKNSAAPLPFNLSGDPRTSTVIDIPAGTWTVTDVHGLLGAENMTGKAVGLTFRGAGSGVTTVVYNPSDATQAFLYNDYWMGLRFEGITFATTTPGTTFMQSYTTHNAQDYMFTDVQWLGPWKYVFDLQGNNNNSEFRFIGCATSGMADDGAFLYIGPTNTSDQFLNYWFWGFKHWSTSASIIDATLGGHFHLNGVDVSDWGAALTAPNQLFKLRGRTHAYGVTTFRAEGVRVEAKNNQAALLYCEWPGGTVDIQCDWTSQLFAQTYGDVVYMNYGNTSGPVTVLRGKYAGGINIKYGINNWSYFSDFTVRDSEWLGAKRPTDVVHFVEDGGHGNITRPSVVFDNVRPDSTWQNPFTTDGYSVWNTRIGLTPLVTPVQERSVNVTSVGHNLDTRDTAPATLNFPIGAIITGITMFGTPGGNGFTGITVTLKTTDGTPVTVMNRVVTYDLTPGFYEKYKLPNPWLCDTDTHATLQMTVTGVSNSNAHITVDGYW